MREFSEKCELSHEIYTNLSDVSKGSSFIRFNLLLIRTFFWFALILIHMRKTHAHVREINIVPSSYYIMAIKEIGMSMLVLKVFTRTHTRADTHTHISPGRGMKKIQKKKI